MKVKWYHYLGVPMNTTKDKPKYDPIWRTMAAAEQALTVMHIPTSEYPWRVHIVKKANSLGSVHAFKTYAEAWTFLGNEMLR